MHQVNINCCYFSLYLHKYCIPENFHKFCSVAKYCNAMPFILHTWMKIFSVKLLKSPFSQKFNDAKISWYTVFWADSIQFYFLNPHGLIKEKIGFEKEQNLQNRNSHTHQIGVQAFCRNLQAQAQVLYYSINYTIINMVKTLQ